MQLEVGAKVFEVVIVGQLVGDFLEGKALIFNLSACSRLSIACGVNIT